MRKRRLPNGLQLTELGLGAAQLGNLYRETTDDEAAGAVAAAWDAGIRYFDTAPHYGLGLSERRLGRLLSGYPREEERGVGIVAAGCTTPVCSRIPARRTVSRCRRRPSSFRCSSPSSPRWCSVRGSANESIRLSEELT